MKLKSNITLLMSLTVAKSELISVTDPSVNFVTLKTQMQSLNQNFFIVQDSQMCKACIDYVHS